MDKIEKARELFRILEGEKIRVGEMALRNFQIQERLAEIRA